MNGLKPIKIPSAKEKVASELRKAILSRKMKEGEILSLDSVATQLNVSITPVREAFQILARDGLIKLRQNKGAIVLGTLISGNIISCGRFWRVRVPGLQQKKVWISAVSEILMRNPKLLWKMEITVSMRARTGSFTVKSGQQPEIKRWKI